MCSLKAFRVGSLISLFGPHIFRLNSYITKGGAGRNGERGGIRELPNIHFIRKTINIMQILCFTGQKPLNSNVAKGNIILNTK